MKAPSGLFAVLVWPALLGQTAGPAAPRPRLPQPRLPCRRLPGPARLPSGPRGEVDPAVEALLGEVEPPGREFLSLTADVQCDGGPIRGEIGVYRQGLL